MRTINVKRCVCASALLLLIGSAANAGPCTNASLIGPYGFQEQGMHTDEVGAFSEFRSVGTISFDGKGHGTKNDTLWFRDFSVSPSQNAVAYSVRPDCSFTFTYENGEIFEGVVVNGGQKLLWLETSGDPMRSGQAERIKSDQ